MNKEKYTILQAIRILAKNKSRFFCCLILSPLSALCSILFSLSLEPIISAGVSADGEGLGGAILIALGVVILSMVMSLVCYRIRVLLLQESVDAIRQRLMKGIITSTPNSFAQKDVTEYISLFNNNVERIKDSCLSSICSIYESVWSLLLSMITIIFYSPWLGGFLLCVGLCSVYIPNLFTKALQKTQEIQVQKAENHLGVLRDIFSGYWIIKNHGVEAKFQKKYDDVSSSLSQADFQSEYHPYRVSWLSYCVTTLSFIGIISICAYLVVHGRLAASMILSLSQLIGGVLVPLESIPQYVSQIKGTYPVFREVAEYFVDESIPKDSSRPMLPSDWKCIQFVNLNFSHKGQEIPIFQNASFKLERGKKYALIGQSGSGKSTLAKILAGFHPAMCQVLLDGEEANVNALNSSISYMDQNVFMFHETIYENISLFRNLDRTEVRSMLERMRFCGKLESSSELLDMPVGEGGTQLSGGERQRVALVRELMCQKGILVLDECTSALDYATKKELEELILNLEGITCLFITHHLDSYYVENCDQIFTLSNGKIVESKKAEFAVD